MRVWFIAGHVGLVMFKVTEAVAMREGEEQGGKFLQCAVHLGLWILMVKGSGDANEVFDRGHISAATSVGDRISSFHRQIQCCAQVMQPSVGESSLTTVCNQSIMCI